MAKISAPQRTQSTASAGGGNRVSGAKMEKIFGIKTISKFAANAQIL